MGLAAADRSGLLSQENFLPRSGFCVSGWDLEKGAPELSVCSSLPPFVPPPAVMIWMFPGDVARTVTEQYGAAWASALLPLPLGRDWIPLSNLPVNGQPRPVRIPPVIGTPCLPTQPDSSLESPEWGFCPWPRDSMFLSVPLAGFIFAPGVLSGLCVCQESTVSLAPVVCTQ